jgi:hypothetical protein
VVFGGDVHSVQGYFSLVSLKWPTSYFMPYKTKIIPNSRSLFLIISRIIAAGEPSLNFAL